MSAGGRCDERHEKEERRKKSSWCPRLWRSRTEELEHPAMMRIASPMVGKIFV
jgi:hypothetical protein